MSGPKQREAIGKGRVAVLAALYTTPAPEKTMSMVVVLLVVSRY
jgi:hypothetical protein